MPPCRKQEKACNQGSIILRPYVGRHVEGGGNSRVAAAGCLACSQAHFAADIRKTGHVLWCRKKEL